MDTVIHYKRVKPDKALSDFVESFWFLEHQSDSNDERIVVPDGKIDLFFSKSTKEQFHITLIGLETKPKLNPSYPNSLVFAISFKPLAMEYILHQSIANILDGKKELQNNFWDFNAPLLKCFLFFCFFFWVNVCDSTNFKTQVMLKSKIKTHRIGMKYKQPHFFILNKGRNSGKPLPEYCANCFVFLADDTEEREFYYFLFQGLWELGLFRRCLIGSVIQFIRIGDVCDIAEEAVNSVNSGNRSYFDIQSTLAQIEAHRANLIKQVDYLMQLRKTLFYKFLK